MPGQGHSHDEGQPASAALLQAPKALSWSMPAGVPPSVGPQAPVQLS